MYPSIAPATPVCVDLDGTLIAADLFWEAVLRLIRTQPATALLLPFWALRGRAFLKRQVAMRVAVDPRTLPYRPEVLQYLERARSSGRPIVLATGSDEIYAREVTRHLGIFTDAVASDGQVNLSGSRKARALADRFGFRGFHYIGNDTADLPVWSAAASASVVGAPARVIRRLRRSAEVDDIPSKRRTPIRALIRAMRPHQWSKNVLVVVPLILAHKVLNFDLLWACAVAFAAFSLCASSIYIINDLSDLEADRLHPRKKHRPFAAGELSVPAGIAAAAVLVLAGIAAAALLGSWPLVVVLLVYLVVTSAYSTALKREPVADVFVLAGLYVLRLVAGGVATGTPLSSWLLAFALFFFLSLAFVKRFTELSTTGRMPGRGYTADDAPWMHGIGISSGYMAVLVLALYINAPDTIGLYSQPQALWLLCPILLFWITRTWFRAGRKLVHDDPVVEALKDPVGYGLALAVAIVMFVAL